MCDFKLSTVLFVFAMLISFQMNEASPKANEVENQWNKLATSAQQRDLAVVAKMCGSNMTNFFNDLDSLKTNTNTKLSEITKSDDITSIAKQVKINVNSSTKHLNNLRQLMYKVATRFRDSYKHTLSFSEITSESAYNRLNEMKKNPIDNTDPLPQLVTKIFSKKYDYNKLSENILAVSLDDGHVNFIEKKSTAQTEFLSLFNLLDKWSQNNNEVSLKAMEICFKGITSLKNIKKNMRESTENILADINEDDLSSIQNAIYVAKALNLEFEDEIFYDSGELAYDDELFAAKNKNKDTEDKKKFDDKQNPFNIVNPLPIDENTTTPLNLDDTSNVLVPTNQDNNRDDNAYTQPIQQLVKQDPSYIQTPLNELYSNNLYPPINDNNKIQPNIIEYFNPKNNFNGIYPPQINFSKENLNDKKNNNIEGDKSDNIDYNITTNDNKLSNFVLPLYNYVQPWSQFSLKKNPNNNFHHTNEIEEIPIQDNNSYPFSEQQNNYEPIINKYGNDLNNLGNEEKIVVKNNLIDFGVPQNTDNAEKFNLDKDNSPNKPQPFWSTPLSSFMPFSFNKFMNHDAPNIEQNQNKDDKIHHSSEVILDKKKEESRAEHHDYKLLNPITDSYKFNPNIKNENLNINLEEKEQEPKFLDPEFKSSEEMDIKHILNENPTNNKNNLKDQKGFTENLPINKKPEKDNLNKSLDSSIEPTTPNHFSPHNPKVEDISKGNGTNIALIPLSFEEKLNKNEEKPKAKKHIKRRMTYLVNKLTGEKTPIRSEIISNGKELKTSDELKNEELIDKDNNLDSSLLQTKNAMQCKNKAFLEIKKVESHDIKKLVYTTILLSNNFRKTVTLLIKQANEFIKKIDDSDQVDQVIEITKNKIINDYHNFANEVKERVVSDATKFMNNVSNTKNKYSNGSPTKYKMLKDISAGPFTILDNDKNTLNMISHKFNINEMLRKIVESSNLLSIKNLNGKQFEAQKILISLSKLINRIMNNFECLSFSTFNEIGQGADVLSSIESDGVTISQNHPRVEMLKNAIGIVQEILDQETAINDHAEIDLSFASNSNQDNMEKSEETLLDNMDKSINNEKELDIKDFPDNTNTQEIGIIAIQPDQTLKFEEVSSSTELNNFISKEIVLTKKKGDNKMPTFLKVDNKETLLTLVNNAEKNGMSRKKLIKKLKKKFVTIDHNDYIMNE
ncbi:metacaspase-2-like [Daktulosphaira vitifoliae]|uniref:metacaspase-2-like n=1 Tax=Daktulosphaira vitifoliae TaxID=58002 RepID=UPI0021AAFF99|nr:metacaspase-2-like [Daktulosphaira vitifoliae]